MSSTLLSPLRRPLSLITAAVLAGCCGAALAQAPAAGEAQAAPKGRPDQRIEQIRTEDSGARIDELRVGGQTQSITVQPKTGDMPEYEVQSPDGARSRAGSRSGAETNTAPRVWNVIKF